MCLRIQIQHEITIGLRSGILKTLPYVRKVSCKGLSCYCLQTQWIARVIKRINVVGIERYTSGKLSRWKEVLCQINARSVHRCCGFSSGNLIRCFLGGSVIGIKRKYLQEYLPPMSPGFPCPCKNPAIAYGNTRSCEWDVQANNLHVEVVDA